MKHYKISLTISGYPRMFYSGFVKIWSNAGSTTEFKKEVRDTLNRTTYQSDPLTLDNITIKTISRIE